MGSSDQGKWRQGGTIYGSGPGLRLPRDPHLRIALAVGATGVVAGALLASGALSGGGNSAGGRWIDPADVRSAGPGGTAAGVGQAPGPGPSAPVPPASPAPSPPPHSGSASPPPSTPVPSPGGIRVFRSIASSLCLAAPADGTADAYQMACSAAPGPRWLPAPVRPGVVTLVSVATGHCLAVDVPDTGDGTPVRQRPCAGGDHQRWRLVPAVGGAVADGRAALANVYSGRCVTLPVSPPVGPPLRQAICRGTPDQHWVPQPLG